VIDVRSADAKCDRVGIEADLESRDALNLFVFGLALDGEGSIDVALASWT